MDIFIKEGLINENDEKHHWIIYMYTFPNGKRYIGKTRQGSLNARKRGTNMVGYKHSKYLYSAIQKYGVENIKDTILYEGEITDDYADRLEQIYILLFKTNVCTFDNPKYGYNLTDGGGGMRNWHPTGEDLERRKIQLAEALTHRKYGPLSEEHKRKCSESLKALHISTEEAKKRALNISKGVKVTNLETGEIKIFRSRTDAAEALNIGSPASINRWITGQRKMPKNYLFENYSGTTTE